MGHHLKPHSDDGVMDFRSDKFPDLPSGVVAFSTRDQLAQGHLWAIAKEYRHHDREFAVDLMNALANRCPPGFDREQFCKACGCTELDPCLTDEDETCGWAAEDLCTGCAPL